MKNKAEINVLSSDNISNETSGKGMEMKILKNNMRRESLAPKIVVCPPREEKRNANNALCGEQRLKTINSQSSSRRNYSSFEGSSSNSDVSDNGTTDDRSSGFTSESGSDDSERQRRHRSLISLRRLFKSLSLTARSVSSSPTENRQPKKQKQPKRILRSPVTYTYVRGLSGLPTQRVPRHTVFCATPGLNR